MNKDENDTARTVDITCEKSAVNHQSGEAGSVTQWAHAPELTIVPIPDFTIDSDNVLFDREVNVADKTPSPKEESTQPKEGSAQTDAFSNV